MPTRPETDLKLRREAIYALGLPVSIKAGYIKHVELSIPWNKLGTDPVVLTFDGVYLVAGPLDEGLPAWAPLCDRSPSSSCARTLLHFVGTRRGRCPTPHRRAD